MKENTNLDCYGRPIIRIVAPKYDDIVDKSDFKPDSENKRSVRASGGNAGLKGVYDSDEKSKSDDLLTKLSDVELMLRSGKLDKADVQVLREAYNEISAKNIDSKKDEAALKASDARSAKVDKILDSQLNND